MSLITKNNYEAFLLDYVEGNLSPEHTAELMLFFENSPELKEDLEEFDLLTLDVPQDNFENKEALKIDEEKITPLTFDDFAIAELEGLNSDKKSAEFAAFLKQNPNKQKEFKVYQKIKLVAPLVVFEDKPALKREQKVIPLYWWYSAAAAVILIVFLLKGINVGSEQPINIIADENKIENKSVKEEKTNNSEEIIEENLIADKSSTNNEIEQEEQKNIDNKKQQKPKSKNLIQETFKEAPILIAEDKTPINKINTKDSAAIEQKNIKENELAFQEEEILYADDVVIVYEDDEVESVSDNSALAAGNKKPSKFDAVRAAVKQQVNEKWLTNDNGESVFAFNDRVLGLFSKKNK